MAAEPGCLDRQDNSHAALANGCQQLLESRPRNTAARSAKIVVDHANLAPAELARSLDETVLTPLALQVVRHLVGRRLAHVNDGAAQEVLRRDLGHRQLPLLLERRCRPRVRASLPSTAL